MRHLVAAQTTWFKMEEEVDDRMSGSDQDPMDLVAGGSSDSEGEEDTQNGKERVYLPGQAVDQDEELVCDESAYVMYHQAQTGAPCLSFDVIRDNLGNSREDFPLTMFMVAGTQAERSHANSIIVMKMSNLLKTNKESKEEEEEDSDSDSDDEKEPELESATIKHTGAVNRVRCTCLGETIVAASWSETGKVYLWDLQRPLQAVNDTQVLATYTRTNESPAPVYTFPGHQTEGYAIDWSPITPGRLATGDCNKNIHLWQPVEGGTWHVDQRPYSAHTASVEDIQWSPSENNVFASCSVDKSIRIWDARAAPNKACMLTSANAHDSDVNVISWNRTEPFIVSGGDDGMLKIWDLRQFQHGKPVAIFKHHTGPITSVEWNSQDGTVFGASGADNQLTLWDLAVERDADAAEAGEEPAVPPQLLFIHQGQQDIKELHWHPQCPGVVVSTALSGFNIFRTISV